MSRRLRAANPFTSSSRSRHDSSNNNGDSDIARLENETRISRLARVLTRVESEELFNYVCSSIQKQLELADNQRYIGRNFDALTPWFAEAIRGLAAVEWFKTGVKSFAKMLAAVSEAMSMNYKSNAVHKWLLDFMVNQGLKVSESATMAHQICLEMIPLLTHEQNQIFTSCILEVIEAQTTESFKLHISLFLCIILNDPDIDVAIFKDFVDIIVGWSVDTEQDDEMFVYCSHWLESAEGFFRMDILWTSTLLSNLVDDVELDARDDSHEKTPQDILCRISRLTKAFNVIIGFDCIDDKEFLAGICQRLLVQVVELVQRYSQEEEQIIKPYLLVSYMNSIISCGYCDDDPSLRTFLLEQLNGYSEEQDWKNWSLDYFSTFFTALTTWVEKCLVSQAQCDEDTLEMCWGILQFLDEMESTLNSNGLFMTTKMVHALLRTRNVTILQKVYDWIVSNVLTVNPDNISYSFATQDPKVLLRVLTYLSDIATNKGRSILYLWALNPSIFDFLLILLKNVTHIRVRDCILTLLKTHCTAHTHFVSSISSLKNFSSDSPTARFLPTLMHFWIELLTSDSTNSKRERRFVLSWLLEFLSTSSTYASILTGSQSEFYESLVVCCSTLTNFEEAKEILVWLCQDVYYSQSDFLVTTMRNVCVHTLLNPDIASEVKTLFKQLLNSIAPLVIVEPSFENECLAECSAAEAKQYKNQIGNSNQMCTLTTTEFNSFLHKLFFHNESNSQVPTQKEIAAAVDFLILSKLKSVIGKPQEFFGHLQNMVKKIRSLKDYSNTPSWKLEFVFELEKKLQYCIENSAVVDIVLPDHVEQYIKVNKTPCVEWIRRMRSDLIEVSLLAQNYSSAFYYSTLTEDETKIKIALVELRDKMGLKGLKEPALYHYINGDYELALELLTEKNDSTSYTENPLTNLTAQLAEKVLTIVCNNLEIWAQHVNGTKENLPTVDFLLNPSNLATSNSLLDLQLNVRDKFTIDLIGTGSSTDFSYFPLSTILKLDEWARQNKHIVGLSKHQREHFELRKFRLMLDHGNLNFVRNWLTSRDINEANSIELQLPDRVMQTEKSALLLLADVLLAENKIYKCAQLYADLWTSVIGVSQFPEMTQGASEFYLKLAEKIEQSEEFFTSLVKLSDQFNLRGREETLKILYERAICSEKIDALFECGGFMYQRRSSGSLEENATMKSTAAQCFTNYLQMYYLERDNCAKVNNKISKTTKPRHHTLSKNSILAMTRVLQLFREGEKFEWYDIFNTKDWLVLLPELIRHEEFRAVLLERFPQETSLYLASFDVTGKGSVPPNANESKGLLYRKGIFDHNSYQCTEINEEPINFPMTGGLACTLCSGGIEICEKNLEKLKLEEKAKLSRSNLRISQGYKILARELERIATSKEELWMWSLQRIMTDFGKRCNSLRKDVARDSNVQKIQAYLLPVVKFLETLWQETQKCEVTSPAELSFCLRSKDTITTFLHQLSTCETAEKAAGIFDSFLFHIENIVSHPTARLPLKYMSPQLASNQFVNLEETITLPGLSCHIHVVSVEPHISLLQTKTKPKKIKFRMSNGKTYEYLVKGNENLNIDAGVMQFLKIAEHFLGYPTRTYSVTPFGKRGGMIQIVEDAIPLFVLYKKYLQRNNSMERTSEMYWRRLNALGCEDRSNSAALRSVFDQLAKETSPDLISRELFMCAKDTLSLYRQTKTFTQDSAVGAAVCYILGLGDRHLDNILIKPFEGQLVHVDFSIIFGRGVMLKVPERVPFRLTQNMITPLQYPGPMGPFASYLESCLEEFQKNVELTLFSVNSVAVAHQLEEDPPVPLATIIEAEIKCAIELIQHRFRNMFKITDHVKAEILNTSLNLAGAADSIQTTREELLLTKSLNRYRRIIANLDPLIQFICKYLFLDDSMRSFKELISKEWIPNVVHFWCHTKVEDLISLSSDYSEKFELADRIQEEILSCVTLLAEEEAICSIDASKLGDTSVDFIDSAKVDATVKVVKDKILAFNNTTTVERLISDATRVENLAQMYEGWTAWV